ncbi:MAG: hypothetical protein QOF19_426 [Alphaproteobacteria bacterium]|jgi:hypothetical protein|nr:hypothetical protein [Alphaproteobacteria bacterium]
MAEFVPVTDEDLARARRDPAFRHKLLADNLNVLLVKLNRLRNSCSAANRSCARHISDGMELAVKLANLLRAEAENSASRRA